MRGLVSTRFAVGMMAIGALAACSDSRAAPRAPSAGGAARPADARPAATLGLRAESPAVAAARRGELRVCADPNNLPFSNQAGEGFENRIAQLLAREMGRRVTYTWWAQRRGFIRNTLKAGACDLIAGVPSSLEMVLATRPYYRSTYVFVYRSDAGFDVRSFDDAVLKRVKVGVQLVGDDYANTPPAHALAARGVVDNVRGYTVYGDYTQPNPPARILDALARGEIDVAVVWGPLAGYFAPREKAALKIVPVSPQVDVPFLPFVFDISMGVRREDVALAAQVERILRDRRTEVDSILHAYGVPRVDRSSAEPEEAR
ncbi:MAG TPA: substrate-binding domain-containing protein [Longimicrobium sp.]|nr:substrate-binding domain-containing protein [Longimicrobium sp.]